MADPPQTVVVTVEILADLMPEMFTGEIELNDCKEFFNKFWTCWEVYPHKFNNEQEKIRAFKYCFSKSALEWWSNYLQVGKNVPQNINDHRSNLY